MIHKKRYQFIMLLIVGIGFLVLIVSNLSEIEFQAAQPFFLSREEQSLPVEQLSFMAWNLVGIWQVVGLIILWVILPISFLYFVVSPEMRKVVIRRAVTLGVSAYALFILLRQCSQIVPEDLFNVDQLAENALEAGESIEVNFSPQTTDALAVAANLIFVALMAILVYRIARWWIMRSKTLDHIAAQASDALDDLRAGIDLEDRILQCYVEMNQLLVQRRGIRRRQEMTAREFETELEGIGLPLEHVKTLTRLFEKARYGSDSLGETERMQAENCLLAIVDAFGDAS